MARTLRIGNHEIGDHTPCYVIAEIGHNHQGKVEKARELFREAKLAGAHAVKLQKRDNRGLYTRAAYNKPYDNENSFGATYGEHREFLEFGLQEYRELQGYARELEVDFFATAFDLASAEFLGELDVPAFKIASGDNTFYPLLQAIAQTGKPAILSTGLADLEQVRSSMRRFELEGGAGALAILHCVTSYPTLPEQANLSAIRTLKDAFPHNSVGYSDHTMGIRAAVASVALGARIIEKHFTIDKQFSDFHDHQLSADPEELTEMVLHIRELETMLGTGEKVAQEGEENNRIGGRRSIVSKRSLRAGETVTLEDLTWMRPGDGMPPGDEHLLLGKRLTAPLQVGEPFSLEIVE